MSQHGRNIIISVSLPSVKLKMKFSKLERHVLLKNRARKHSSHPRGDMVKKKIHKFVFSFVNMENCFTVMLCAIKPARAWRFAREKLAKKRLPDVKKKNNNFSRNLARFLSFKWFNPVLPLRGILVNPYSARVQPST